MSARKTIAVLLTAIMLCSLSACGNNTQVQQTAEEDIPTSQTPDAGEEDIPVSNQVTRGTVMSSEQDGSLDITRCEIGDLPMGEPGTWTIFVYLCGSDLESGNDGSSGGFATSDLSEMLSASTGDKVHFVIQTGGASAWQNDTVSADEIGRYEICNGNITKIETLNDASMGDAATLSDFISWGVNAYPAANMGLVFWDHGGGCITGVCLDRVWDNDILYLKEIDSALASVSPVLTEKFEFIGFDACLMATVECANILSPYAKYMYASEELEPGGGWDYEAIGNYLQENPLADGDALGRIVCDSYYEDSVNMANTTFSIVDLSKINNLVDAFHSFSKQIETASVDMNTYSALVRNIISSDNFGGNTKATGYSNMVDLLGIVSAGAEYADNADSVISAIEDVVVYARNNIGHENACGLSTYYPLAFNSSAELSIFSDLAISPYYLAFVTRTAYGLTHNGDMSGYVAEEIVDEWNSSWNNETAQEEEDNSYWNNYNDATEEETDSFIEYLEEPCIRILQDSYNTDYESFGLTLTEESVAQIARYEINMYQVSDDGQSLIYRCCDIRHPGNNKTTFSLSSLQPPFYSRFTNGLAPITYYIGSVDKVRETESMNNTMLMLAPVYLNDREANLIIGPASSYKMRGRGFYEVYGVWDGIGDDSESFRMTDLKEGDVIRARYQCISAETKETVSICGDKEYKVKTRLNPTIKGGYLYIPEGTYYVNYTFYDAFGNYCNTDYAKMYVGPLTTGAIHPKISFDGVVEDPLADLMTDDSSGS